jgi:hypothetical protein
MAHEVQQPLVIACSALTAELRLVLSANGLSDLVDVHYLPANLHNTPHKIVGEVRAVLDVAVAARRSVFVAYADCGTGGLLDALLSEYPGVERIAGAHCYEFFSGSELFAAMQEEELGTFYLTDFLAKHFDALVWSGLGLDRAPQLRDMYFGHYTRVMFLSQADDVATVQAAELAAQRLGLAFEHRHVGRDGLAVALNHFAVTIRKAAA